MKVSEIFTVCDHLRNGFSVLTLARKTCSVLCYSILYGHKSERTWRMAEVTGELTVAASVSTASQTERAVADVGSAQALAYEADGSR